MSLVKETLELLFGIKAYKKYGKENKIGALIYGLLLQTAVFIASTLSEFRNGDQGHGAKLFEYNVHLTKHLQAMVIPAFIISLLGIYLIMVILFFFQTWMVACMGNVITNICKIRIRFQELYRIAICSRTFAIIAHVIMISVNIYITKFWIFDCSISLIGMYLILISNKQIQEQV